MSAQGLWWLALGLGLVVAVVVVMLLEVFLHEVHRIERGAGAVWQAGQQVAGNTASTWLLAETSARLGELIDEAGRHGQLLRGESGSPSAPKHDAQRSSTARWDGGGVR